MVNRVVVGAHYGSRDWLMQRITAVLMAVYIALLPAYFFFYPRFDYDAWTALFSSQLFRSFTLVFLLCLFYHAWIGVRDVVMDYISPAWLRLLIHVAVTLTLLLYAIWSVLILWRS